MSRRSIPFLRRSRSLLAMGIISGAVTSSACTSPTHPTKTVSIPPPAIACPAPPPPAQSSTGQPVVVTYGAPVVTDGTSPVSATCTPSSGSSFAVGSTIVTCTATDAVQRTASCSFAISVIFTPPPPRLGVTKFLAFGDSITAGAVPDSQPTSTFRPLRLLPPDKAYPGQLEAMLKRRYTAQPQISVANDGKQGERAVEGVRRLDGDLLQYRPDVLLLLEGVNDLNQDKNAGVPRALAALRSMIVAARLRGVGVMVGTLLPQNTFNCRVCDADLIVRFNSQLSVMAQNEGAVVVDLYQAFAPHVNDWLSSDGLHPNETGYQQIAQVFFNAIKGVYELPASVGSSLAPQGSGWLRPHGWTRSP